MVSHCLSCISLPRWRYFGVHHWTKQCGFCTKLGGHRSTEHGTVALNMGYATAKPEMGNCKRGLGTKCSTHNIERLQWDCNEMKLVVRFGIVKLNSPHILIHFKCSFYQCSCSCDMLLHWIRSSFASHGFSVGDLGHGSSHWTLQVEFSNRWCQLCQFEVPENSCVL